MAFNVDYEFYSLKIISNCIYVAVKILKFPEILIRYNMTTEQRQQISELAEQASAANDIKTLIRLKKLSSSFEKIQCCECVFE